VCPGENLLCAGAKELEVEQLEWRWCCVLSQPANGLGQSGFNGLDLLWV